MRSSGSRLSVMLAARVFRNDSYKHLRRPQKAENQEVERRTPVRSGFRYHLWSRNERHGGWGTSRLDERIQYDPFEWNRETSFGWAFKPRGVMATRAGEDFDLPSGDDFVTTAAITPLVDRFPAVKNVEFTQGEQLLLGSKSQGRRLHPCEDKLSGVCRILDSWQTVA